MLRGARAHLAWLAPLVVLILEAPLLWPLPHVGDWFYLWFAGHIVATGGSPFDIASWIPATRDYGVLAGGIAHNSIAGQDLSLATSDRWLWPPIVAFLLAPFGALPLWLGVPLLHLATIAMCVASALLLVRTLLPPPSRPLALALLIASAPAVEVMRAGNPAAFLLPGIALTYAALRTPSAVPLAAGALGIFVRWSLFPLAALGTAVAFLRRGAWRPLAVAATALVVIEVAAYALTPFSPAALLDASSMRATQDNASTWQLAGLAGDAAPLVSGAVLLVAGACFLLAVRRAAPETRNATLIAAALALAVAVTPYTRTYDDLALFPAWVLALRSRSRLVSAAVVAAVAYGWAAWLVSTVSTQAPIALAPILALVLLATASGASPSSDASS